MADRIGEMMSESDESDELQDEELKDEASEAAEDRAPSPKRPARAVKEGGSPLRFLGDTGQFWRDIRAELKRVSWPTTVEVKNTTIITLIAVVFFSVYLFLVDRGLVFLIGQLRKAVSWLTGAA